MPVPSFPQEFLLLKSSRANSANNQYFCRFVRRPKPPYGIEAAIQVVDFGFFPKVLDRLFKEGPARFTVPLHLSRDTSLRGFADAPQAVWELTAGQRGHV